MSKMWEYGIICNEKDEKIIIKNIIEFLESFKRTITKTKNKSLLEARLPYVYKHYYWNLNKEQQVYFEIYPNRDMENKYKFKDNQDSSWILFIRLTDLFVLDDIQVTKQDTYIRELINAIRFNCVKIYEYVEGEERL